MTLARLAFYVFWIAPAVLLAALATVMRIRRLDREWPAFFAYCVFSAARTPILFWVYHRTAAYFYCYWVAEAVSTVLALAAIYEVFLHLFRSYGTSARLAESLFRWVGAALVLAAVVTAMAEPGNSANRLMAASLVVNRGNLLVQCGLLFFLFAAAAYLRLSWRTHAFGIASGFALFLGVQLAVGAAWAQVGLISERTLSLVQMGSYTFAVLVWMTYLLAPQPAEVPVPAPRVEKVKSWNQALLQLLLR
jgi:hypothetical protein